MVGKRLILINTVCVRICIVECVLVSVMCVYVCLYLHENVCMELPPHVNAPGAPIPMA